MTQPIMAEHCWHTYVFNAPGTTPVSVCCFCSEKVSGVLILNQSCPRRKNVTGEHGPYISDNLRKFLG